MKFRGRGINRNKSILSWHKFEETKKMANDENKEKNLIYRYESHI